MSNRVLVIFITVVVVLMGILFLSNLYMLVEVKGAPHYIAYNDIRGMDIYYKGTPYTADLAQQTEIAEILNGAKHEAAAVQAPAKGTSPLIQKIVIYRFNQPNIVLSLINKIDDNLIFSVPEWVTDGVIVEQSHGRLLQLLSQTYDP